MEIKQKKAKSLYLMKIFMEETDEDHGLTLKEINSKLEGYGIKPVSRNTLYGDIEELRMFGLDIVGRGEQTFQWIVGDIKPWVDASLRTWAHREATGIGGSSMGGIMSLYGAIAHNDVFSKAACLSTGVRFTTRQVNRDLARTELSPDTRIYLSWGEHESGRLRKGADPATQSPEAKAEYALIDRLDRKGVNSYLYFQPDGQHNEASWEQQNGRYLDYLWRDIRW